MKKFQIFRINSFKSHFYGENFKMKKLRSALKRPLKFTKFHINNLLRNNMATNLNFSSEYGYFDTIFIFAGNIFTTFILYCALLMI